MRGMLIKDYAMLVLVCNETHIIIMLILS